MSNPGVSGGWSAPLTQVVGLYPELLMKTYFHAWCRGIGALGLYLCFSIVTSALCALAMALPEKFQVLAAVLILLFGWPPLLFYTLRWLYPEIAAAKSRVSKDHYDS